MMTLDEFVCKVIGYDPDMFRFAIYPVRLGSSHTQARNDLRPYYEAYVIGYKSRYAENARDNQPDKVNEAHAKVGVSRFDMIEW